MDAECPDENALLDLVSAHHASPDVARHVAGCVACTAVLADAFGGVLAPGATLGRYRIIDVIGRGGTGAVYAARDELLDRPVAIKLLRRSSPDDRARLLREARLIAKLDHRNIVRIYDAGDTGTALYYAMELVSGSSLRDRMSDGANPRELVRALRDAGRGLAAAHRAGVAHRDFKPANVLVSDTGRAVVVDFGLAAVVAHATEPERAHLAEPDDGVLDAQLTSTGAVLGTPAYMAPEQMAGRPADARSDQYSFCASLYEALIGALPFAASSFRELQAVVERGRLDPDRLAQLPRHVRRVVTRGMAVDPARRYPSMDALLAELDGRPRRVIVAALGAAFALGAVGAGYVVHRSSSDGDACTAGGARAAALWDPNARGRLSATVGPEATTALDRWLASWRATREAACRTAGPPGDDTRSARELLCLDDALVDLGATIDVLASTDAPGSRAAIAALPSLDRCRGARSPTLAGAPRATRADRLRRRLAVLAALGRAGGVELTVLAGTAATGHRLYRVTLPDGRITELGPIAYAGDLWELVARGPREAFSFDRERDTLVALDRQTGAIARAIPIGADVHHNGRGMTLTADGTLVALVRGHELVAIDRDSGRTAPIAPLAEPYQLEAMTTCPDGAVYGAGSTAPGNPTGRILYRLDVERGAAAQIAVIGDGAIDIDSLTCTRDGTLLGVDSVNSETIDLVAIDARTGAPTTIATLPGPIDGVLAE